ncbi:TPA: hypothetical protein ACH3X3_15271 [Trebouxia sp. C0006]
MPCLIAADQAWSCIMETVHGQAAVRLPRLTCCHHKAVQDVWAPPSDAAQRLCLLSYQSINRSINQAINEPLNQSIYILCIDWAPVAAGHITLSFTRWPNAAACTAQKS